MNEYKQSVLKAGINRILEDGIVEIKAHHLKTYSKHDDQVVEASLRSWEKRGLLTILKPYTDCLPEESCIKMHQFIDMKSPIRGFLNWED